MKFSSIHYHCLLKSILFSLNLDYEIECFHTKKINRLQFFLCVSGELFVELLRLRKFCNCKTVSEIRCLYSKWRIINIYLWDRWNLDGGLQRIPKKYHHLFHNWNKMNIQFAIYIWLNWIFHELHIWNLFYTKIKFSFFLQTWYFIN